MDRRNGRTQGHLYGEAQVKRIIEGTGTNIQTELDSDYIVFCPYHNNFRTPAAEISKESGVFFCFACQTSKTFIDFVMDQTGKTYFEAVRYIKSAEESEVSLEQQIDKALFTKPDYTQFDELLIKRLNNQALESPRAMRYYEGRRVSKNSVIKFNLGYSEKQDMISIPVESPDGVCVGFVGRSVEGKEFKNTPKLPKSKVLFNLHRIKKSDRVYVVESSLDVIRLDQVGLPAVATLGANVSNTQIELLQKYFNNIIIIADNDAAGGNMKDRIIEKLGSRVSVIQLDKRYKDIGDMEDDAIKNLEFAFDQSISSMLK